MTERENSTLVEMKQNHHRQRPLVVRVARRVGRRPDDREHRRRSSTFPRKQVQLSRSRKALPVKSLRGLNDPHNSWRSPSPPLRSPPAPACPAPRPVPVAARRRRLRADPRQQGAHGSAHRLPGRRQRRRRRTQARRSPRLRESRAGPDHPRARRAAAAGSLRILSEAIGPTGQALHVQYPPEFAHGDAAYKTRQDAGQLKNATVVKSHFDDYSAIPRARSTR